MSALDESAAVSTGTCARPENELRTYPISTAETESDEAMFSMGDLLCSVMASPEGKRFADIGRIILDNVTLRRNGT